MTKIINAITFLRIFLAFFIFGAILINEYFIAFILFFIAGTSDYFDGYFARKYNATSELGEILDPIADKVLVICILFALSVNSIFFVIIG